MALLQSQPHQQPMPREEQTLEEIYKDAEFGISRKSALLTGIENDWGVRMERARIPPPCVLWDRVNGYGQVPGLASGRDSSGKRGRGRPRKYPLPPIERVVQPMSLDPHPGIPLPSHLLLPGQLYNNIEYDADGRDCKWLELLGGEVKVDLFEQVIHGLEYAWFRQTRMIQRQQAKVSQLAMNPDAFCEICRKIESDNPANNVLVLCDGCDLAVHQECYGIPHIPEGPWMCRACGEGRRADEGIEPACCLCPWPGGALKPTTDGRWAHLVCAQWIPGALILNPSLLEPIDLSSLEMDRFKLKCYLCQVMQGAPIQCDHPKCSAAFHPHCGFRAGLTMKPPQEMSGQPSDHQSGGKRRMVRLLRVVLCGKHGPVDLKLRIPKSFLKQPPPPPQITIPSPASSDGAISSSSDIDIESDYCFPISNPEYIPDDLKLEKRKDALVQIYPLTVKRPPVKRPPSVATKEMLQRMASDLHTDHQIVAKIAKYWSLKRAAQCDYPLIKRLQFEPWTPRRKATQLVVKTMEYLVQDLRRVQQMAELAAEIARQRYNVSRCIREMVSLINEDNANETIPVVVQELAGCLDDCMDEFVWVLKTNRNILTAAKIYSTVTKQVPMDMRSVPGSCLLVRLYDKRDGWMHCEPRNIHILSNSFENDQRRLAPAILDRDSHALALKDRRINHF